MSRNDSSDITSTTTNVTKGSISEMSYQKLLRGKLVDSKQSNALRKIFDAKRKCPLNDSAFDRVISVIKKLVQSSINEYTDTSILTTGMTIAGALYRFCDSEDRLRQLKSIMSLIVKEFSLSKVKLAANTMVEMKYRKHVKGSLALLQAKPPFNTKLPSCEVQMTAVEVTTDKMALNKGSPGIMRLLLDVFDESEEKAIADLKNLEFETFRAQSTNNEREALTEVIRKLLRLDSQEEHMKLICKLLKWMQRLCTANEKSKGLARSVSKEVLDSCGTLWFVRWLASNNRPSHVAHGAKWIIDTLESIDLTSEVLNELVKIDYLAPVLAESIPSRFSKLSLASKQELIQSMAYYLQTQDMCLVTNMNSFVISLVASFLWMLYYQDRSMWDLLFGAMHAKSSDFDRWSSSKTCIHIYTWFETGTVSPLLAEHVTKAFWFCEACPRLYFEFYLAVSEPNLQESLLAQLTSNSSRHIFNKHTAPFVLYIFSPPPEAFGDMLRNISQHDRLERLDRMRNALIPSICALFEADPSKMLRDDVRCSIFSKLLINLKYSKQLKDLVRRICAYLVSCESIKPWVFALLEENISMNAVLFSHQARGPGSQVSYFSDFFLEFCHSKIFESDLCKCSEWQSVVKMLIGTGIPSVISKVRNRLKDVRPPQAMKSSDEISFWQLLVDLNMLS